MGELIHDTHILQPVDSFLTANIEGKFIMLTDVEEVKRDTWIITSLQDSKP